MQEDTKQSVLDYIKAHPSEGYLSVALKIGVSQSTVARIALAAGIRRKGVHPDLSKLADESQQ
jgi:predicted protein tyrosine phosphatase